MRDQGLLKDLIHIYLVFLSSMMMTVSDLVVRCRSYRRFDAGHAVDMGTLRDLVDLARLSASGANLQPMRYVLVTDADLRESLFSHLRWAGYLPGWDGPEEGERPTAYIVMLSDGPLGPLSGYDPGIAAQNLLLGAVERGLGGCILGSIDREGIRRALEIPGRYDILLVIALGRPVERVVVEAGPGSGALITADAALSQGRPVFAVPGR
ncbi:MAG TPA: hypothetical protein EYP43_02885, partial [Thermoplasmata archaeon]|nr:hypothetical protein [Thermoplasmata archaeon]